MKLQVFELGKKCAGLALLSISLVSVALGGQVVDRVVANVNGHVVLQSDWEEEVAFEAFSDARDPDSFTSAERAAALDRLVDQELLREQVRPTQPPPSDQVAARVAEVRKLYPDCVTDDGWHVKLKQYGLSQGALEQHFGDHIRLMRLVEDRLRPSIQIDQRAVENYYHDQLLPKMNQSGSGATPLKEVFNRIKDLLAERKMNELLSGWLANLRSESHILTPDSNSGERTR